MCKPLVSVLMCTYNPVPEFYLESVNSILLQTYQNLEIIIINDGSSQEANEVINSVKSDRVTIINNSLNCGLTKCLNQGLEKCHGDFIARMDDDDICLPTRIEEQVNFFLRNKDVNVLGTDTIVIGNEERISHYVLAETKEEQQVNLFFENMGLAHPTVMFRRQFLKENNIRYNEAYRKSQDYRLWVDCTKITKMYCIDHPLLKYRVHSKQVSSVSRGEQLLCSYKIHQEQVVKTGLSDVEYNSKSDKMLLGVLQLKALHDIYELGKWIRKLNKANKTTRYFDPTEFRCGLSKRFYSCILMPNRKFSRLLFSALLFPDIYFWGVSKKL